jgi:hypothetical protein
MGLVTSSHGDIHAGQGPPLGEGIGLLTAIVGFDMGIASWKNKIL